PDWVGEIDAGPQAVMASDQALPSQLMVRQAGCALVDGAGGDPLGVARRVHRLDPALQVVVVAPAADRKRIARALLFSPGLGEVWIVGPEEAGPALIEKASAVTAQRRAYRSTRARIEHDLAAIEPMAARRA